jgi:hypothetical protein
VGEFTPVEYTYLIHPIIHANDGKSNRSTLIMQVLDVIGTPWL